jgi:hypothetical protein
MTGAPHPWSAVVGILLLYVCLPTLCVAEQAVSGEAAVRLSLLEELRLDASSGSDEYVFPGVGPSAMSSVRVLYTYVSEAPGNGSVRVYDSRGRFVRRIGRTGAGPGEYDGVEGLGLVGDTLLVVYDRGNRRISLYDSSGAYLRQFAVEGGGLAPLKSFAVLANGLVAVRARIARRSSDPLVVHTRFRLYRLTGELVDSLEVPPEAIGGFVLSIPSLGLRRPFLDMDVFALLPDGRIATARTSTFRVTFTRGGAVESIVERPRQRVSLAGQEREEWVALSRRSSRPPTIPAVKPALRDLFADEHGRVWVELYTRAALQVRTTGSRAPAISMMEPNVYEILSARGESFGYLELPPLSRVIAVRGSVVWLVQETDDGDNALVRYRLTRAGS